MGLNILTLGSSKSYTDETVIGGGAIKGKNCTIEKIEKVGLENVITFKWTLDDGTEKTGTMKVKDGSNLDISKLEGNSLVLKDDGLYVPIGAVKISEEEGNGLTSKDDGLYVKVGEVTISKAEGNTLEEKDDGLYVPTPTISKVEGDFIVQNGKFKVEYKDSEGDRTGLNVEVLPDRVELYANNTNEILLNADTVGTQGALEVGSSLLVDTVTNNNNDKIIVNSDTEINGDFNVTGNFNLGDSTFKALDFESKGGDFVIKDSDDGSIVHQLSKKQDDFGSFVYADAVKESFSNNRLCVDGYMRVLNDDTTVGKDYDRRTSEFRIGRDGFNLSIGSRSIQEGEFRNNYVRAGNSKMELHSDKKLELSSGRGLNIGNSHSEIVLDDDGPTQIKTPWTKFSLDGNGNVSFLTDYNASAQFGRTEKDWKVAKRILKNVLKNLFHGFHVNCNDEIKLSSQKWIPYYADEERAWLERHSFLRLGQKEAKLMHVRYNSVSGNVESKQGIKCGPYGGVFVYGDMMGAPAEGQKGYVPVTFRGGIKVVFPGADANWEIRADGIYRNGVKKV